MGLEEQGAIYVLKTRGGGGEHIKNREMKPI